MISSWPNILSANNHHPDADVVFDVLQEYLNKYFEHVYQMVRHPRALVIAIESILQNPKLTDEKAFLTVLTRKGLSALESYEIEARQFFAIGLRPDRVYKPLWRLEGDVMRRWGVSRTTAYTVHEAFWLVFLHRYVGTSDNTLENMVFEGFKQTTLEHTTALSAIVPSESLESFCSRSLRYVYTQVESHDFQNQMRFLIDEVFHMFD